jgi:hypothetical protein
LPQLQQTCSNEALTSWKVVPVHEIVIVIVPKYSQDRFSCQSSIIQSPERVRSLYAVLSGRLEGFAELGELVLGWCCEGTVAKHCDVSGGIDGRKKMGRH